MHWAQDDLLDEEWLLYTDGSSIGNSPEVKRAGWSVVGRGGVGWGGHMTLCAYLSLRSRISRISRMILLILLQLDGDATRLKFGRIGLKISLYT